MIRVGTRLLFLATLVSALLVYRCDMTAPNAGGATDSPNAIAGVVVDLASGEPVPGVRVLLLRDVAHDTTGVELTNAAAVAALDTTTTDSKGTYIFMTSQEGIFALFGKTPSAEHVFYGDSIVVHDEDVTRAPDTLTPAGSITGATRLPEGPDQYAVLVGTPFETSIGPDGRFVLAGIPAGTYQLWTVLTYETTSVLGICTFDTVAVVSGQATSLDTLRIDTVHHGGDTLTIADLEEGSEDNRLGVWWPYLGETSTRDTMPIKVPEGRNGGYAATVSYTLGPEDSGATIGKNTGQAFPPPGHDRSAGGHFKQTVDLSSVRGMTFWIRAHGATSVVVRFHSTLISDWNDLVTERIAISEEWTQVSFDTDVDLRHAFDTNEPRSWADAGRAVDALMFHVSHDTPGQAGQVWIDDVRLIF